MRFAEIGVGSWSELSEFASSCHGFIFRGQANSIWQLSTSLERSYDTFQPALHLLEVGEKWTLHEFQSKFHLYSQHAPADENAFEWLALLQHHGCPTRLLDFTHSLYIAAHFAVAWSTTPSAIWAVNSWSIRDNLLRTFELGYKKGEALRDAVNRHHIDLLNECISTNLTTRLAPHLIPVEPTRPSQRVARQQGLFLAPTTLRAASATDGFLKCLFSSFYGSDGSVPIFESLTIRDVLQVQTPSDEFACLKFVLPRSLHREALKQLDHMGITDESLFPDLDGLARSLVLKHIRQ